MALSWRPPTLPLPARPAGPGLGWLESRLRLGLRAGQPLCLAGPRRPSLALAAAAWPGGSPPPAISLEGATSAADLRVLLGQALGRWPAGGPRAWQLPDAGADLLVWVDAAPLAPVGALLRDWGCRALLLVETGRDCGDLERISLPQAAEEEPTESRRPFDPVAEAEARRDWLRVAEGEAWPARPTWADGHDLEALGREHPRADLRFQARAVAARLWSSWGEDGRVDSILEETADGVSRPLERGWLAWAAAEHRARWGRDASGPLNRAAEAFREGRALGTLAALRRWEASLRLAQRQPLAAARAAAEARALSQGQGDRIGVGRALAISGELALATGEHLSAEVLLDQARQGLPPGPARLALDLSRIRAELSRGGLPAAPLPGLAGADQPVAARATEAAVGADLALRRGELERATALAAEAEEIWALLGEPGPAAVQARLQGDAAALAGQPALALACWRRALRVQLDRHDADAAARSAARLALLLEATGQDDAAEALRAGLSTLNRRSPR